MHFYFMDSENVENYDKTDKEVIEMSNYENIWSRIEIGKNPRRKFR